MVIRTLAGACLALVCLAAEARPQTVEMPWPKHLTASDRRDLLALAKKMGMHPPLTIRQGGVESIKAVNDHESRWSFAMMVRADHHDPKDRDPHVGRWYGAGPVEESGRWRIQDASWSHEVSFHLDDPAVNYEDTVRVVLAIHRRTLLNRQQAYAKGAEMVQPALPDFDASPVSEIAKPFLYEEQWFGYPTGDALKTGASRMYQVTTWNTPGQGGLKVLVHVTDEGVELIAVVGYEV